SGSCTFSAIVVLLGPAMKYLGTGTGTSSIYWADSLKNWPWRCLMHNILCNWQASGTHLPNSLYSLVQETAISARRKGRSRERPDRRLLLWGGMGLWLGMNNDRGIESKTTTSTTSRWMSKTYAARWTSATWAKRMCAG